MKFLSLISTGIDSPVSTYLFSKKATEIIVVHFSIAPFSVEKDNKDFVNIVKHLKKICDCEIKTMIVPHGQNLKEYIEFCNRRYTCVFCKRMMLRVAEKIAEKNNIKGIITGDNLGQVASQTLKNIYAIDSATKIPVLRPLIGFDKEEIIDIAKEIGTFELSINKPSKCTAVPNKPATEAKLEKVLNEEEKIDIEKLVDFSVGNSYLVSF
jgi:tRNA uracil 4-sulfurtransferase